MIALIVLGVVALFVVLTLARTIRVIPQARAGVVERFGRYSRTLNPGLVLVAVSRDSGRVKLAGEVWTARNAAGGYPLEVGSQVRVVRIDGATAVVAPAFPRATLGGAVPPEGPVAGQ